MFLRRHFLLATFCLLIALELVEGCKRGSLPSVAAGSKAFESAAPELREAWSAAVAADRTNGYAEAYATLIKLRHPSVLTPDQLQAVNALYHSVTMRLSEALKRGDPAAKQAAEEIGNSDRRGR
jgi:hypothetical protein